MRAVEVQTDETLRFVLDHVPGGRLRILEVGCGRGELAKRLGDCGHEVVAIDSSPERVSEARRLGVAARAATFPDFADEPFDVVLFTRSLHHIRPLAPAVGRARELLKPEGTLLVEDFAFDETTEATAALFHRLLRLLEACGGLAAAEGTFGSRLLRAGGDFSLWREHEDELNSAPEMADAIGARFEIVEAASAPYLYRYVSEMVEDGGAGKVIVERVLELEKALGAEDRRHLIGRRFVAVPRAR